MSIERKLIGTLVKHPELYPNLTITDNDFSDKQAGKVFAAVSGLISNGTTPDVLLVAETLGEHNSGEWLKTVSEVYESAGAANNLLAYQDIVRADKRKLDLQQIAETFTYEIATDAIGATHRVVENIREVEAGSAKTFKHVSDYLPEILQKADDVANGLDKGGLTTGIPELDKLTDGLHGGDSVIIAARTSVGKTAFMCNLAANVNAPCGVISAEQSGVQITNRILARMGGISAHRLKTGRLRQEEFQLLADAAPKMKDCKIQIVDQPRLSIDDIERLALGLKWEYQIEALFIDYLQLIGNRAYTEKRLQIADISARCKALARELDIPVVTLAQLNRNADGRQPRISDLKESGSIEEDADLIILLYKDEHDENKLIIDVQKSRDGPTGFLEVEWNPDLMTITGKDYQF